MSRKKNFFLQTQKEVLVRALFLGCRLIKTSDASCVIINSFDDLCREVLNFRNSGSIRRKKALEMRKCSVV